MKQRALKYQLQVKDITFICGYYIFCEGVITSEIIVLPPPKVIPDFITLIEKGYKIILPSDRTGSLKFESL